MYTSGKRELFSTSVSGFLRGVLFSVCTVVASTEFLSSSGPESLVNAGAVVVVDGKRGTMTLSMLSFIVSTRDRVGTGSGIIGFSLGSVLVVLRSGASSSGVVGLVLDGTVFGSKRIVVDVKFVCTTAAVLLEDCVLEVNGEAVDDTFTSVSALLVVDDKIGLAVNTGGITSGVFVTCSERVGFNVTMALAELSFVNVDLDRISLEVGLPTGDDVCDDTGSSGEGWSVGGWGVGG